MFCHNLGNETPDKAPLIDWADVMVLNVRGATHEKVHGELKRGFAFDSQETRRYHANSAWLVFSIIAFNLNRAMQAENTERRSTTGKRRTIWPFQTIQALRYGFINGVGLLSQPGGRQMVGAAHNPMVRERFNTELAPVSTGPPGIALEA